MTSDDQNNDIRSRLQGLIDYIASGRGLEAMDEFYHDDVEMQENLNPPTVGKAANRERERAFFDNVAEFKSFEVPAAAAEGDTSFYHSRFEFVDIAGETHRYDQVTMAKWRDGKIYHERFIYDSGGG